MSSRENITVLDSETGQRLDRLLAQRYPQYSRSAIEKLIESGDVRVNGGRKQTRYKVKSGDTIEADFSYFQLTAPDIQLPILYEDENVVVINKPVGILSHSKGAFNKEATVATWLKSHSQTAPAVIPDANLSVLSERQAGRKSRTISSETPSQAEDGETAQFWNSNRAGIVHRLDRATSGVMIVAKNKEAENYLKGQFSKRNVKKTYIAVISGELPEPTGLIDVPIERNPKKPATFRAGVNGKPAQTRFQVLKNATPQNYSLVELQPITGRTHQLRVHMNYLKRPIVGDDFYGGEPAPRLMLHAKRLEITLPGGNRQVFEAPVPIDLGNLT